MLLAQMYVKYGDERGEWRGPSASDRLLIFEEEHHNDIGL